MVFRRRDGLQHLKMSKLQRRDRLTNTGAPPYPQSPAHQTRPSSSRICSGCNVVWNSSLLSTAGSHFRRLVFLWSGCAWARTNSTVTSAGKMSSHSLESSSRQACRQMRCTSDTSNSRRQSGASLPSVCGIWQPAILFQPESRVWPRS